MASGKRRTAVGDEKGKQNSRNTIINICDGKKKKTYKTSGKELLEVWSGKMHILKCIAQVFWPYK